MGTTRVLVVTERDDLRVVAYYMWCTAHVTPDATTPRVRNGAASYPRLWPCWAASGWIPVTKAKV